MENDVICNRILHETTICFVFDVEKIRKLIDFHKCIDTKVSFAKNGPFPEYVCYHLTSTLSKSIELSSFKILFHRSLMTKSCFSVVKNYSQTIVEIENENCKSHAMNWMNQWTSKLTRNDWPNAKCTDFFSLLILWSAFL